MRTTVNLDQDILEIARSLAAAQGVSVGAAICILARRGLSQQGYAESDARSGNGRFPTFSVAERTPRFGTEEVRHALDDE